VITVEDSFSSADVDAVELRLGDRYGRIRLGGAELAMDEQILATAKFCLNRIALSGTAALSAEVLMPTSVISSGTYRWEVGEESGDAQEAPFLLRPQTAASASMADTEVIALTFDPATLQRTARALYGDDTLTVRFASGAPISAARSRLHRDLLRSALTYLPLLRESELLESSLYRVMAASLLESFPLLGEPARRRTSVLSQQQGYRRARAFIDDHAAEPITIEDVAAAASLSVAQLNRAFRALSATGADAAGALRRARLAGAHEDLVAADPARGDSVRDIALRWGFTPHNFARSYRATYGVSPRQTLSG
jgi:AraC-like DNA-binding protein